MPDTDYRYDFTARFLHWLSALIIVWATLSGLYIVFFPVAEHSKQHIGAFNVSLSVLFIPLFCYRILHRIQRGIPDYPATLCATQIMLAKAMHIFLYALISIVLLSGLLMMKEDYSVFGLFSMPHFFNDTATLALFKSLHAYSTRILGMVIVLHLLAVFKHELGNKRILRRML